ncbi:MAG TPA: hypothetical protein VMW27_21670 [Thermoanaerobaculia bacterium]|nr:hypothetical protein [Thermoanaerobaculia bacterium]
MTETPRTSSLPHPGWLPEARQALAGLGLSPEWPDESIETPGQGAKRSADCALRLLAEIDFQPDGLHPSLEGGVRIAFVQGGQTGRYADVQFLNSGEVVATCSERGTPQVWSIQPGNPGLLGALDAIRSFVAR